MLAYQKGQIKQYLKTYMDAPRMSTDFALNLLGDPGDPGHPSIEICNFHLMEE